MVGWVLVEAVVRVVVVSRVNKSVASSPAAWVCGKLRHPVSVRRGVGPRWAAARVRWMCAGAEVVSELDEVTVDAAVIPGTDSPVPGVPRGHGSRP